MIISSQQWENSSWFFCLWSPLFYLLNCLDQHCALRLLSATPPGQGDRWLLKLRGLIIMLTLRRE